ncbi:hypothetical protein IMSHALPRED_004809 [Imshaugia aleurites]|uniref:J domain-containing protein n=1 Tax=Imshaugia aleurites TaxID=172621 RepID=A0A8H3ILU2_9LECA|nr:hypothetical protein IMSHALPRED_004809 [Imshaugia aleurites]
MAPTEPNIDYYAVLEISHTTTIEVVIQSYQRLAKIRHPDKNLQDGSTAVFQLLQNAYDTDSDPAKRSAYDLRWPTIRNSGRAKQESEKLQAEAAQGETRRTAEARAKKPEEDST